MFEVSTARALLVRNRQNTRWTEQDLADRSHQLHAHGGETTFDTVSPGWIVRMDTRLRLWSFWPVVAMAALPGSGA